MTATEKDTRSSVGTRVPRIEDARLLTGAGSFVDDIVRPGMLHAHFLRSPYARAQILGIDTSDALALEGVITIYLAADLNPGVHEFRYTAERVVGKPVRPPLAEGEVRFAGDPVALIIAEDRYIAEDAAERIVVEYEPLTPVVDYETAYESDNLVHSVFPDNLAGEMAGRPMSELEPLFTNAAHVVEQTVHQQAHMPIPMETRGVVAEWSAATGDMTVWASTQSPHEVRMVCARVLGIDEHRVRVIVKDTGGGFGQKVVPQREDICVMLAAKKLGSSLKWIEDRQEHLMSAGMARQEHGTGRFAFDADGRILAADLDYVQNVGAYPITSPMTAGAVVGMLFPGPYRVPEATFRTKLVYSNTVGRTAYRGPWQFESMAREVALDTAARRLCIDPIELRRRNLLRVDELPATNPNGMPYSNITPRETFEQALEILDYPAFRSEQHLARMDGRFIGVGTCTYLEPTTGATAYHATEGATIRIEPSGKVNVYVAGGSCGNSLETTVVQLTADALSVEIGDVNTVQGDTAVTPFGAGTGGSRSASMTAGAVAQAAAVLRKRILAIAAHTFEVDTDDVEFSRGRATVRGVPNRELSLTQIADIAYFQAQTLPPDIPSGLEVSERYRAASPLIWANATHVCTCEVDVETGEVTLLRYIVSDDCGPMINPNVVEGQIYGGTVQGIGGALYEHLAYDDAGNPITTTFMDYLLPTANETPVIELGHIETPGPGPGGYKGVGEGGAIGSAPAVVNAVVDALAPFGVEVDHLPLSPSRIIDMLDAARTKAVNK
ncbi:xanthine dehydrogenase family protein molybdopterin-binding subunit [Rhodococcus sp. CH91]|uniref:xanthine dehydrogenase family protein molybdopterin-binding subunit n=1 Tax=Rhodococcus sp. CH91 TaxID=2910256 RepID=UPI001F4B8415|nr:xanthine dehydrogenase family protein molybdopterin-binding subunit [Rhodococcus sp. CH91]